MPHGPINQGYWIEGKLVEMAKGKRLVVDRSNRNGEEIRGTFETSYVENIKDCGEHYEVVTESNSRYKVEFL